MRAKTPWTIAALILVMLALKTCNFNVNVDAKVDLNELWHQLTSMPRQEEVYIPSPTKSDREDAESKMEPMNTGKPTGHFLDDARWNHGRETVDFTLRFRTDEGEQDITCRVSREALEDRARTSGEIDPMKLYETYRSEIRRAVDRKLKAGIFEADDLILIVSGELKPD